MIAYEAFWIVDVIEEYPGYGGYGTEERSVGKVGPFESEEAADAWADKEAVKNYDQNIYNKNYLIESLTEPY